MDASDLEQLEKAIAEDGIPESQQKIGTRVAGWIGRMMTKAASGAWDVSTNAAGEILARTLGKYYNLPQ